MSAFGSLSYFSPQEQWFNHSAEEDAENQRRLEKHSGLVEDYVTRNKGVRDFAKYPVAFNYCEPDQFVASGAQLLEIAKRQEGDV